MISHSLHTEYLFNSQINRPGVAFVPAVTQEDKKPLTNHQRFQCSWDGLRHYLAFSPPWMVIAIFGFNNIIQIIKIGVNTEIPRRMNSTNIFTSKGDDFDNLVLSLASFPPVCIIFGDPLSQIWASEMIYSGRFKSKQRVET